MTKAESALKFITESIQRGQTIYINTAQRAVKVTPKTFAKWEKSGVELFRFDKAGNLWMAFGKNYNVIATKNISLVGITAL